MTRNVPLFIAVSDCHFTSEVPGSLVCSQTEWEEFQLELIREINYHAHELGFHNIICAGDFFDKARQITSTFFNSMCQALLSDGSVDYTPGYKQSINTAMTNWHTIAGQHDLPFHNMENLKDSWLWALMLADRMNIFGTPENPYLTIHRGGIKVLICGYSWQGAFSEKEFKTILEKTGKDSEYLIAFLHRTVWKTEPFPGADIKGNVTNVGTEFKKFDMVVSGDNHIPFMFDDSRYPLILNGGALIPRTISEVEHDPSIYLVSLEDECLVVHPLTYKIPFLTAAKKKTNTGTGDFHAFIEGLAPQEGFSYDFKENLNTIIAQEKPSEKTKQYIFDSLQK